MENCLINAHMPVESAIIWAEGKNLSSTVW